MTKIMESTAIQQIEDILAKHDRIGIAVSKNPSLDTMAAALSLALYLRVVNKQVVVACPTEPIVEISNLVGINTVKTQLSGEGGDLTVSFPYKDGEIDKVSYTLEDGLLNIIVKAGRLGLSFDQNQVRFKQSGSLPTALFVVGTPRVSDLGHLFVPQDLQQTTIINIDNKADNQGFGDVIIVSHHYSSVSEQIADLLVALQANIDVDIAQNLLLGITQATRNFQASKTSATAFEMAGMLMRKGAVREAPRTLEQPSRRTSPSQRSQQYFGQAGQTAPRFTGQQDGGFTPQRQQQQQRQHRPSQGFDEQPIEATERKEVTFARGTGAQPQQQAQNQSRPTGQGLAYQARPFGQPKDQKGEDEEAPPDWLTPKVYKGSSLA
ncbi:MAG: hypothetical protein HY429_02155 [Candidatus Levybacteria bacterium]|nr:hypothetical protein [Candidatus Levybacteria bacterium]